MAPTDRDRSGTPDGMECNPRIRNEMGRAARRLYLGKCRHPHCCGDAFYPYSPNFVIYCEVCNHTSYLPKDHIPHFLHCAGEYFTYSGQVQPFGSQIPSLYDAAVHVPSVCHECDPCHPTPCPLNANNASKHPTQTEAKASGASAVLVFFTCGVKKIQWNSTPPACAPTVSTKFKKAWSMTYVTMVLCNFPGPTLT